MNAELVDINKKILMEGLFANQFETDDLEQKMADLLALENKKKEYLKTKPVANDYQAQWMELDSEYKLNDYGPNKIENFKSYRDIYDRKFELIKNNLSIVHKDYDGETFYYLIRKI